MINYAPRTIGLAKLFKKLDKMSYQCTRDEKQGDAVLILEGREGTGKTDGSIYCAGYVKHIAHRDIYMYFDLDALIRKAQSSVGKVLIWDEPALQALSTDSLNKLNKNLIRLLMTCRINRHFFIINIVDFTKFNQYITVERPLGFIHFFKGRVGHACYIRYKRLESLRRAWDDHRKRLYTKHKNFFVDFPSPADGGISDEAFLALDITINNIPHATRQVYEEQKRLAISQIGDASDAKAEKRKLKAEIKRLKSLIGKEPRGLTSWEARAKHYKVSESEIIRWSKYDLNDLNEENDWIEGDVPVLELSTTANIDKRGVGGKKTLAALPPILNKSYIIADTDNEDDL